MPIRDFAKRAGRGLAVAVVALAAVCLTAPNAAQARIDTLLRRCESLEHSLAAAHRNLVRTRQSDVEAGLREEISHLEGQLAEARAEVRRAEEATRGQVASGKRPIEIE